MTDLPDAMVERAARARYNLDRPNGTDWWTTAPIPNRAVELVKQEAALAAALEGCDVRVDEGMRQIHPGLPVEARTDVWDSEGAFDKGARSTHADWMKGPLGEWTVTLLRRLIITTPAEAAEPEAERDGEVATDG